MESIGDRIKEARIWKNMSQEELAKAIGSTKSAISRYESSKRQPRIEQLQRIADILGVGVSYLLSGGGTVSQTNFANGVHIYKNTFPFKNIEPFLDSQLADSCDILYQDEYLIIAVEKESTVTDEELQKIIDTYAPSKDETEFLISVAAGEFHTRMNTAFLKLNYAGRQEAMKRVEELAEIPRYRAETTPQAPLVSSGGTDTTPAPPETPPEDE